MQELTKTSQLGRSVRRDARRPRVSADADGLGANAGFWLYLLFVVSWFARLPARIPALGAARIDLLLVAILTILTVLQGMRLKGVKSESSKAILIFTAYAVLVTPFVEWPGTVFKFGLPEFIKALVFFYFTVAFVRTSKELSVFVSVLVVCLAFRILEPVYLHVTTGYYGSAASMENGAEFLARLSGGPYDTINPNGLAFVVCMLLPFLYFLAPLSVARGLAFILLAPLSLYAFSLTGSRSGLVGLAVVFFAIAVTSRFRLIVSSAMAVTVVIAFSTMSPDMRDRYLSTIGRGEKNAATANERLEGTMAQFEVAMRRPLFGHGLGTSREANSHFTRSGPYVGRRLPAHNLFVEVWQEMGLVGLALFGNLLLSIFRDFLTTRRLVLDSAQSSDQALLAAVCKVVGVCLLLNVAASLSSYGIASYDWYLLAGLSLVIQRLVIGSFSGGNVGAVIQRRGTLASHLVRRGARSSPRASGVRKCRLSDCRLIVIHGSPAVRDARHLRLVTHDREDTIAGA